MTHRTNASKVLIGAVLVGVLAVGGTGIAFAALNTSTATPTTTTMTETASAAATESTAYGYLVGQQANADRSSQYSAIAGFTSDEDREAYFEEQGIEGQYSTAQYLDTEALVAAGVIDQKTADAIADYASQEHASIDARYTDADLAGMTQDERQEFYEGLENDSFSGDSIDGLVSAGVITQEQADAINAYLSANSAE